MDENREEPMLDKDRNAEADRELVKAFHEEWEKRGLRGLREIARESGIPHATVRRLIQWNFRTIQPDTRQAIRRFLTKSDQNVSRGTLGVAEQESPGYETRSVLTQLVDLLKRHEITLEDLAEQIPAKRLAKIAYSIAVDRSWPRAERRWLVEINERLIEQGAGAIPITINEDVRAAAERLDLLDRQAQTQAGVDPALPRGEQRRLPRHKRGNR